MAPAKRTQSDGNIFQDVGFSEPDSASLVIRADLMIEISDLIKRRGLTQAAAAELMGVTQPRISDLVRGKIELFSIDTLVNMIARAGGTVRFNVRGMHRAA